MGFIDLAAPVDIWREQSVRVHYDDGMLEIQRVEWRNLTDSTLSLLIRDGNDVLFDREIRPFETNEEPFPAGYQMVENEGGFLKLPMAWRLLRS